jgi:hypothetical protein
VQVCAARGGWAAPVEEPLAEAVGVLVTIVEACGAAVVITGARWAFIRFLALGCSG